MCESGWNGGAGYTPEQVGKMSLDQIWFRLCDLDMLKKEVGSRTKRMDSLGVIGAVRADKDGIVHGRAADGTSIVGRVRGKSVARQLMEEEEEKRKKKKDWERRKAKRERRRKKQT